MTHAQQGCIGREFDLIVTLVLIGRVCSAATPFDVGIHRDGRRVVNEFEGARMIVIAEGARQSYNG